MRAGAPRDVALAPRRFLAFTLTLALALGGCLSRSYVVPPGELARLARTPTQYRWQAVRVLQRTVHTDEPPRSVPLNPTAAPAHASESAYREQPVRPVHAPRPPRLHLLPESPPPLGDDRDYHHSAGTVLHNIFVGDENRIFHDSREDVSDAAGRVFWVTLGMPVMGPWLVVGLATSEAVRFDGWIAVNPDEPVYVRTYAGERFAVPLSALTSAQAAEVVEAHVYEGRSGRFVRRARAPIDRDGYVGAITTAVGQIPVTGAAPWGAGVHWYQGFNYRNAFGAGLFTDGLVGAPDASHTLAWVATGAELQLYFVSWLGAYVDVGFALRSSFGPNVATLTATGAILRGGLFADVPVLTRLSILMRAGVGASALHESNLPLTLDGSVGIAVY